MRWPSPLPLPPPLQPPTLNAFSESRLLSDYAQYTPVYKSVSSSSAIRVGIQPEASSLTNQQLSFLKGLKDSLPKSDIVLDPVFSKSQLSSLSSSLLSIGLKSTVMPPPPPPTEAQLAAVKDSLTFKDAPPDFPSSTYQPFSVTPITFTDVYLQAVLPTIHARSLLPWEDFLSNYLSYASHVALYINQNASLKGRQTILLSPTSTSIYPPTPSSASIYTPSFSLCAILLDPTPQSTLSAGPSLRLAIGLKPRYIIKNEPWGGRKVSDFIIFTQNPKAVTLDKAKINYAQGF